MNLAQIKNGEEAVVIQVNAEENIRARLRMLNVCPGAKVKVVKRSLLSSSLLLEADGVRLGLRRELAENIRVLHRGL